MTATSHKPLKALLVASGKGGVGKSSVASLLAVTMAQMGLRVGLLDADLTGPSIPTIFGLEGLSPPVKNKVVFPFFKFGVHLLSYGNFISSSEPVTMRGPLLTAALTKMIESVQWPPLDLLLIDMPPSTSDLSLTCCGLIDHPCVLLVCQNDPLSLSDARRAANHYYSLNIPLLGIVESMAPDKNNPEKYSTDSALPNLCHSLEIALLGAIPYSHEIRRAIGSGQIHELINEQNRHFTHIKELTDNVKKSWDKHFSF